MIAPPISQRSNDDGQPDIIKIIVLTKTKLKVLTSIRIIIIFI